MSFKPNLNIDFIKWKTVITKPNVYRWGKYIQPLDVQNIEFNPDNWLFINIFINPSQKMLGRNPTVEQNFCVVSISSGRGGGLLCIVFGGGGSYYRGKLLYTSLLTQLYLLNFPNHIHVWTITIDAFVCKIISKIQHVFRSAHVYTTSYRYW